MSRDLARRNDPEYLLSTSSRNRHSLSIIYTLFLKKRDSFFVTFRFVFVRLSSPQGRWRVHRSSPRFHDLSLVNSHDQRTRFRLLEGSARPIRSPPSTLATTPAQPQSHNFTSSIIVTCLMILPRNTHEQSLREHLQRPALRCSPSRRNSSRCRLVSIGLNLNVPVENTSVQRMNSLQQVDTPSGVFVSNHFATRCVTHTRFSFHNQYLNTKMYSP